MIRNMKSTKEVLKRTYLADKVFITANTKRIFKLYDGYFKMVNVLILIVSLHVFHI